MKFPKLTKYQTVLEIISLLLLIANAVYIICEYSALPAEIPMHYNADGSVRDYESKSTVWPRQGVCPVSRHIMYYLSAAVMIDIW